VGGVIGVIPARWSSTRYPGKPLAQILGKPMLQHVYDRAKCSKLLDEILIATDDDRIREAAQGFGARVIMTSSCHPSGTDRVSEAVASTDAPHIINVQGDEPLLRAESIDEMADELMSNPRVGMTTLACRIRDKLDLEDPSCVKVVIDKNGDALYFSRACIPHLVDDKPFDFYRHIGIYGYRREVLAAMVSMSPSPLEVAERLEQLRALENGIRIRVVKTAYWGPSVDTPADIAKVEAALREGQYLRQ
jgi:3-deoxy-manno-octulosonate cytidylyltransferase (CMP-KDO synthetase)